MCLCLLLYKLNFIYMYVYVVIRMFLQRKRDIGTVQSESNAPKSIEYYCLIEPCQYHVHSSSSRGTSSSKYRAHTYLEGMIPNPDLFFKLFPSRSPIHFLCQKQVLCDSRHKSIFLYVLVIKTFPLSFYLKNCCFFVSVTN
ncbi:hypothetical protein POPTR_004G013800v4 [Populus trichocarpa]|jgi:hypothetical protein|uniref:Uncharacterized protein n=1 Tax=Populus trichocarpa TaxID=3694 RepID=A0A2K2ANE8_POPTR|nr:hypothetical protein BDE02_04G009700 [Populus trichocarpa]PNT39050.1 hypothetical protein POPTR_004G013800v4 [Populus trichocarpa]